MARIATITDGANRDDIGCERMASLLRCTCRLGRSTLQGRRAPNRDPDFEPKGAVARSYGGYRAKDGAAERALFVLDGESTIRVTDADVAGGVTRARSGGRRWPTVHGSLAWCGRSTSAITCSDGRMHRPRWWSTAITS